MRIPSGVRPWFAVVGVLVACTKADNPTGPVTGGLAVDSTMPASGATGAPFVGRQIVYCDQALNALTVTSATIGMVFPNGSQIAGTIRYDEAARAAVLNLALVPGVAYTGLVTTGVRGAGGESLDSTYRWSFQTRVPDRISADAEAGTGAVPALVTDAAGVVHVAYADEASATVRYARCASACIAEPSWSRVTVSGGVGVESRLGLAVAQDGSVAMAYYRVDTGALGVSVCSSVCQAAASWQSVVLDDAAGDVGFGPSIDWAPDGALHVIYQDRGPESVRYTHCASGCGTAANWAAAIVIDQSGAVGRVSGLGITSTGRIHAAWTDDSGANLVYAGCIANCGEKNSWTVAPLLSTASSVDRLQLVVDQTDRPAVAFGIDNFVAVGFCPSSTCVSDVNWGLVGLLSDAAPNAAIGLAISADRVHVAYPTTQGTVRYLTCTSLCATSPVQWVGGTFDAQTGATDGAIAVLPDGDPVMVVRRATQGLVFLK